MAEIGDSVRVRADAVRGCTHRVHQSDARPCLEPDEGGEARLGAIYDMTAANGGPEMGHGYLVALDCRHGCVACLSAEEMTSAT